FNGYNPMVGQSPYYPQTVPALPAPLTPNPVGVNGYNPIPGQSPYYPQTVPISPAPNPVGFNGYNPMAGQSPYYPQTVPALPAPLTQNPALGQTPVFPQSTPPVPYAPNPTLTPPPPTPITPPAPTLTTPPAPTQQPSSLRSSALTAPYLGFQGTYINQGDESAARARLSGLYPLSPRVQFGGSLDLITGDNIFSDSRGQGLNINELYVSAAPFAELPNLRLVAGQLDLTSYFDRNSFAKDGATHFFNSVFQTNPALSATGISSRPGVLVNWTVTDNIEAKAAVFSSSRSLGDFSLDGFAGEIGFRYGNGIIRGTYATARDAGSRDSFQELFQVDRGDGRTGPLRADREEAYGVNAEYFFPDLKMGIFGRYGRYENQALNLGGNTYSFGISFLDLFLKDDRLGLAYGRGLSNEQLRREFKDSLPDVLELFYDVRIFPNLRLGVTLQERNGFSELYGGFRVKTEFDITPKGR
ncbi:MAG TPA: porin, partial [Cyanobacteria bacterium UBA8543]|nr:porin [Cyanobacteria bacterium UBA8543]